MPTNQIDEECDSATSSIFVFEGSIQIASATCEELQDGEALAALLSAICLVALHNIALTHHIKGIESQCSDASFIRSMEYYALARDLHCQSSNAFGRSYSASGIGYLPAMSILNNMGVLSRGLKPNQDESEFYFRELLSAMACQREMDRSEDSLRSSNASKCRNRNEVAHSLNGFWANLSSFLLLDDLQTAKAA